MLQKNANLVKSPVADAKAIKNETEVYGFRQCHLRDGAALIRYFAWLEEQLEQGAELSESTAADQLEKYRSSVLCPPSRLCKVLTSLQRERVVQGLVVPYDLFDWPERGNHSLHS